MSTNPFDIRTIVLARHAQHVVLIHFPIALFTAAVGFDCIAEWMKSRTLAAADFFIGPSREIALVEAPDQFLEVLRRRYLPRTVLAGGRSEKIPLLKDRPAIGGMPTAYVCENHVCQQPVTSAAEFDKQV